MCEGKEGVRSEDGVWDQEGERLDGEERENERKLWRGGTLEDVPETGFEGGVEAGALDGDDDVRKVDGELFLSLRGLEVG